MLIIEVASPGTESSENYQRDYQQKPAEYTAREIPEMWLIDPERKWVKIGTLIDGAYQFANFTGNSVLISSSFPGLNLTAAEILSAGR
jgi:Uma2 family endonuclease